MGATLVYHPSTENLPHLMNRFSVEASTSRPRSGYTSPLKTISTPAVSSPAPASKPNHSTQGQQAPSHASADIEWDPSLETYLKRVERLASLGEPLPRTVPEGFPTTIQSARAWEGADFEDESAYVYTLTANDLAEVDEALRQFQDQSDEPPNPEKISPQTFRLPKLGEKLGKLAQVIHSGQGFFVLRGLDPEHFSIALDKVLAYAGITCYIGETRACQDAGGSRLIHIKDRGVTFPGAEMRQAPYSNVAQPFHTDACDILVMYVQELAAEGGHFKLASSAKIYNDIAASRPDVIHALSADDWVFDKFNDTNNPSEPTHETRPILLPFGANGPSFFYSRRPLTGSPVAPRNPNIPPMSERQAEALDMVHFTAVRNQLSFTAQRGDVILVNNLSVMHARDRFVDDFPVEGKEAKRRHVMRLWLRNEELQWEKPSVIRPVLDLKYDKESEWCKRPVWHLEVPTEKERMLARRFTCS